MSETRQEGGAPGREFACPAYVFASDVDGDRYLIVDDGEVDCTGWSIEADYGGSRSEDAFEFGTVYGSGAGTNLIGFGEKRQAWLAFADWGMSAATLVLPDGRQHIL